MQATEHESASLSETLGVLKRRWAVIVACMVVVTGLGLGAAQYIKQTADVEYEAIHRLVANTERGNLNLSIDQAALLVNEGELARPKGVPGAGVTVDAVVDKETATLGVRARSAGAPLAADAADGYAEALLTRLSDDDRQNYQRQLSAQTAQVDETAAELNKAQAAFDADKADGVLLAERDSALNAYRSALDTLRSIQASGIPEAPLVTLNSADARRVPLAGYAGFSRVQQGLLAASAGLLLGLGLIFLLEALDRRLTTAETAAEAFGVPVLTEVPHGGSGFAKGDQLAPAGSLITEAYRRLRTIVQLERQSVDQPDGATVVLVTSPGPEEGKTTTVAHLARALGEVGNRVLAVSADFRRPRLHRYFGVEAALGLAVLNDGHVPSAPDELIQRTTVDNVWLVTAGGASHDPTGLIHQARLVVQEAKRFYDFVVIDSSPLLSANDALDFVPDVDAVVTVCRYRTTNRNAAERTRDLLLRTSAPTIGVVLTGVRGGEGYGYYYGGYRPPLADMEPVANDARS